MKQQTLIVLYGPKKGIFGDYLLKMQWLIQDVFPGKLMKAYLPEQVHGTLIGLETRGIKGIQYNLNILEKEGKMCRIKRDRIPDVLSRYFPMKIRFGGFTPEDVPFLSRGEKPYYRSFRIDWQNRRVLIMGWPHVDNDFSGRRLWKFRDTMKFECHAAHKYEDDNDFYVVLGEIRSKGIKAHEQQIRELEEQVRKYMEQHPIDILVNEILIAVYTDPRLPPQNTQIIKIQDTFE